MSRVVFRTVARTRTIALLSAVVASGSGLACGALIGTRDLTEVVGDGGASGGDDTGALHDGNVIGPDGQIVSPSDAGDTSLPPLDGSVDDASKSCVGADLQTNKYNCGVCGHDCLGGNCAGGACQPFTLVAGQAQAQGITVDATHVYWTVTTTGVVAKANLDGTGFTVLSQEGASVPWEIVVDDTNVYWTNVNAEATDPPGRVERCPKTGCTKPTYLTAPVREAYALAIDNQNAYWSEWDNGAIGRVNEVDGGGAGYLATEHGFISGLALDNGTLYFTSTNEIGAVASNGALVATQSTTTTTPFRVIYNTTGTSDFNPYGIAVDGTNVYWANNSIIGGGILYAPKGATTTSPTTVSHDVSPSHVALDATNIYWIASGPDSTPNGSSDTYESGYLAMCPKAGCPNNTPVVLAKDLHNPRGLAVDATAVYFTIHGNPFGNNPNEGSVMKIAK